VSGSADQTIRVWDLGTGAQVRTITDPGGAVQAVAVAEDGRRAISGGEDGAGRLWNLDTGALLHTLAGHAGRVRAVAITLDGSRAVSGADRTVRVWDLAAGTLRAVFTVDAPVACCALTADGRTILAGDTWGRIYFLRMENA